ncbi:MAG: S-layer homology domain-containing protein [Hydrogenibacillus schlegelii]|nr:S-layer homology domain-containing protein [Hydrogenibacillus schlegelii]
MPERRSGGPRWTGLGRKVRAFLFVVLAGAVFAGGGFPTVAGAAGGDWEEPIGEGVSAFRRTLSLFGKPVVVYGVRIDLTNPFVRLVPLTSAEGLGRKAPVPELARAKGAIAAVNADFFHLTGIGAPLGPVVDGGTVMSAPGVATWDVFGLLSDGRAVIGSFWFEGTLWAPDGSTHPIRAVNKEAYDPRDGRPSHAGQIVLYTPAWGAKSYGRAGGRFRDVVEVVVAAGVVRSVVEAPDGSPIPPDGFVLWGEGPAAAFLRTHFAPGDPVRLELRAGMALPDGSRVSVPAGALAAGAGATSASAAGEAGDAPTGEARDASSGVPVLLSTVGSHRLLVEGGRPLPVVDPAVDGDKPRARAAVAIDAAGRTVWLVVVEASAESRGMTLPELAQYLASLGADRAINLDGGGSATFVARRLGETAPAVLNRPSGGSPRAVPTAIGVLNTAPPGDSVGGLIVRLPKGGDVLAGGTVRFEVKAYDTHYLPLALPPEALTWSATGPAEIEASGPAVRFPTGGTYVLTAAVGDVRQTLEVRVLGGRDVLTLEAEPATLTLKPGGRAALTVWARLRDGRRIRLAPENVTLTVVREGTASAGQGDGRGGAPEDLSGEWVRTEGLTVVAGAVPGAGWIEIDFDGARTRIPVVVRAFDDLVGHWAEPAATALYARGIVAGVAPGRFAPDKPLTRAEAAVLLDRALGAAATGGQASAGMPAAAAGSSSAPSGSNDRTDHAGVSASPSSTGLPAAKVAARPAFRDAVPPWAETSVASLQALGVLRGYPDGTFRPDRPVSRTELAVLVDQVLARLSREDGLRTEGAPIFRDAAAIPVWAREAVARVVAAGVMRGTGAAFDPHRAATRAEAAAVFYNLLIFGGSS